MNDIRRTVLWVIFGFSMVLLWDKWQIYNGHKATFFPTQASLAGGAAQSPASAVPGAVPAPVASASPAAAGAAAIAGAVPASAARQVVQVSTDVLKLSFDSQGGSLVRAELLKEVDNQNRSQNVVLMDQSPQRVYMAQTGLIGADGLPNHKTEMTLVPGPRSLEAGQDSLTVRFESPVVNGVKWIKTYTLRRSVYAIDVQQEVQNMGSASVSPQLYMQLVRDGNKPEGESKFYSTFTGPAVYTEGKKYEKIDFSTLEKDHAANKPEFKEEADNGYVAMVQHYFASAWWLKPAGLSRELFARQIDANLFAVGMITPLNAIAPGASKTVDATLYVGPEEERNLEALYPGLELVKDYGRLTILARPLFWLLNHLHNILGNWGWSIMALVLLLKIAFFWFNAKAYQSMAKMKAINPRITEMRERLKDKPQEMQQQMMKIYKEEKVNPMGGCFPIVIQIPVFISLYWVLLSTVEMRNAPWILWIHDLSSPDPFFILPVIMTLTSLLQTSLNPAPPDPMQAKMMWIMPLVFSVMFFFFPAGLVLYWVTNNTLSIAQQWLINARMGVPPKFHLPKF